MNMKKWSKKIAMLVLSLGMMLGTSVTAFAYVPDDVNAEAPTEVVQEETTAETTEDNADTGNDQAFSVPGNGEVLDNIKDDSSKEFYTITTANNNTYYLVIDHSSTTDNVYMLSRIDENDLKDFIEESSVETPETTPSVVIDETPQTETPSVETEPEKDEKENPVSTKGAMVALILAALLGVGAYGYFKVYKPRQEEDDTESEHMETEMFQTINEEEEARAKEEEANKSGDSNDEE